MNHLDTIFKNVTPHGYYGPMDEVVGSNFGYYGDIRPSLALANSFMHQNDHTKSGFGLLVKELLLKYELDYVYALFATHQDTAIVKAFTINTQRGEYLKLAFLESNSLEKLESFSNSPFEQPIKKIVNKLISIDKNHFIEPIEGLDLSCFYHHVDTENESYPSTSSILFFLNKLRAPDNDVCYLLPIIEDSSYLSDNQLEIKSISNKFLNHLLKSLDNKSNNDRLYALLFILLLANKENDFLELIHLKLGNNESLYDYFMLCLLDMHNLDTNAKEMVFHGVKELIFHNTEASDKKALDFEIHTILLLDALAGKLL